MGSKYIDEIRKFYDSVMEEWFKVEKAAAEIGRYTPKQQSWREANRHKFDEASLIYQLALLESIHSESVTLRWLTVALIFATSVLALFAAIQVFHVIG